MRFKQEFSQLANDLNQFKKIISYNSCHFHMPRFILSKIHILGLFSDLSRQKNEWQCGQFSSRKCSIRSGIARHDAQVTSSSTFDRKEFVRQRRNYSERSFPVLQVRRGWRGRYPPPGVRGQILQRFSGKWSSINDVTVLEGRGSLILWRHY